MIYNIFIGLAIGIVVSIFIVGFICVMFIAGRDDMEEYRPKKTKKSKKK